LVSGEDFPLGAPAQSGLLAVRTLCVNKAKREKTAACCPPRGPCPTMVLSTNLVLVIVDKRRTFAKALCVQCVMTGSEHIEEIIFPKPLEHLINSRPVFGSVPVSSSYDHQILFSFPLCHSNSFAYKKYMHNGDAVVVSAGCGEDYRED
jgi:hypothetical protein